MQGADATFVTAEPPGATTSAASSIGSTSATLNGRVDPNGRATTYLFEYGTTTSYGTKTPSASAGSGEPATNVSKTVTGLKPGTTYHFRLVATSDAGTSQRGRPDLHDATAAHRRHGSGVGRRPHLGNARRHRQSQRALDVVVRRVRDEHVVRLEDLVAERRLGDGDPRGRGDRVEPEGGRHLPLPPRRDERARNDAGRGRDLHDDGRAVVATGPVTFTTLSLSSARVNGTVNPHGLATRWWFEYGRTASYGRRTAAARRPAPPIRRSARS